MSGLIESASAILSASERRLEVAANNVVNMTTAGFKRQIAFSDLVSDTTDPHIEPSQIRTRLDLSQGQFSETRNPLDISISGTGFFRLRANGDIVYSRQGQFQLGADGRVMTAQGYVLQQADGGDIVLDHEAVEILADGTILDEGRPVARIGLFEPVDANAVTPLGGSLFAIGEDALEEVADPQLRQGMIETSNVSLGDEMVGVMAALRQAESGARLVQLYDDLMGRAVTTIGQAR